MNLRRLVAKLARLSPFLITPDGRLLSNDEIFDLLFPSIFDSFRDLDYETFHEEIAVPVIDLFENIDTVLAALGMTVPDFLFQVIAGPSASSNATFVLTTDALKDATAKIGVTLTDSQA